MDNDLGRLHDAARGLLIKSRDDLIANKGSSSVLKKTRKTLSQLDWGVEQYADGLDDLMRKGANADMVRSYIRKIEEKALKDFQLLADDSVHHKVQSRTGGDTLSKAGSKQVRSVVKRLEDKYGIKFGNSSGPGGNLTADLSLSNYAHKADDRARGLEKESGIGKNPDASTTAHARGTAGYAKNLSEAEIANEESLFNALDKRVGDQIQDARAGLKTDAPRQQAIRDLANDPLLYSADATAADVAKGRSKLLSLDPSDIQKTYQSLKRNSLMANGLGAAAGFLSNGEAVDKALKGDYKGALKTGAKDAVIGEGVGQVLQRVVSPLMQKLGIKGLAGTLGQLAAPVGIGLAAGDVATRVTKHRRRNDPNLTDNSEYVMPKDAHLNATLGQG